MDDIIVILLVIAAIKFVFFGIILLAVFKPNLRQFWLRRQAPETPACIYCQSRWTRPRDEGQLRFEDDAFVLVTEYECDHCRLPFWHVERRPTKSAERHVS